MFSATLRLLYPRERGAVIIVQEAGWASRPVWTGTENPVPALGFDPRSLASHYTDHAVWLLLQAYICTYICMYIYIYMCVCVCVFPLAFPPDSGSRHPTGLRDYAYWTHHTH